MCFTGINYYKLAVEKDRDSIFTTIYNINTTYGNLDLLQIFLYGSILYDNERETWSKSNGNQALRLPIAISNYALIDYKC